MTLSRISTLALQQTTLGNAMRVMNDIAHSQNQVSSGFKASRFSEMSDQVELFSSLEKKLARSDQYLKNNIRTLSRLQTADTALSAVLEEANKLKNLVLQRRNDAVGGNLNFEAQMRAGFFTIAQQLNSNVEGRYIFGGTHTNGKPVNDAAVPSNVELGVPDTGYYQGGVENMLIRPQDDVIRENDVRADAEAIQKIMAAFGIAISGDAESDDGKLVRAYDLLAEGVQGVINLQSQNGSLQRQVRDANERHETQKAYWGGLKDEILSTDIVAVSAKLAVDQATLQATFQVFGQINRLRLSDYLS